MIIIIIVWRGILIIYADVLFVINFFITFLLLKLTNLLLKNNAAALRLLASSAVGGLYSLVIFADRMGILLTVFGKLAASLLIIFISFGGKRVVVLLKALLIFYFSNMLFLGITVALIYAFKPSGILLNNSIVYFDISARMLVICAVAAYLISVVVIKIYNRTISKSEIYNITIHKNDDTYRMLAFADTGNKLREPFSDFPVIIADKSKFDSYEERIIPFNTVGGEGMLKAFKPDKVIISNGRNSFETDRVYVALSEVENNEFSAIINPEILNI